MYADYMRDPQTPDVVRKAKPSVVLRLLENRAADHYQTIATNETASWTFRLPASLAPATPLGIRLRFTNQYEMRQDVRGVFTSGGYRGVVSNITQAVVTVPFAGEGLPESRLEFANRGKDVLMLRPRKDINLLIPADGFRGNLLRAYVELLAILTLVVAFGLFLSAGLGRPVALFVAFVTLIVGEMSPSVVEEYPDELETKAIDRIGLIITRAAAEVTRPVSAVSPLEALAKDECVEARKAARLVATDALALPLALALLAALVLPHKQDVV